MAHEQRGRRLKALACGRCSHDRKRVARAEEARDAVIMGMATRTRNLPRARAFDRHTAD